MVQINHERGLLTIQAHLPSEAETEQAKEYRWHQREMWYGDVSRTISLPASVDAEKAEATLTNGVLTLVFPKQEAARPRQIPIKAAA